MTIAPLDLILLLGSLQGFILVSLLWFNPNGNRLSNRLLAALIGSLALMSLAVGIPIMNRWVSYLIDFLPWFIAMPIGPLVYFYVKSVLNPAFRLGRTEKLHFLPVILDCGAPLIGWVFMIGFWLGLFEQQEGSAFGQAMTEYNTYIDIPRWLSITVYLFLTRRLLRQQPLIKSAPEIDQQRRRWLAQFVTAVLIFQAIWLLFMVPYVVPGWRNQLLDQLGWYPVYIPMAILIYWLGLRGYLHSRMTITNLTDQKPAGVNLPPETLTQVVDALERAMKTDRLFLDPALSVDTLGKHIQLSPKLISAVLNQHLRTNFNAYINRYRVEAVTHCLTNPANNHLTLTGIAFKCGFNSQATFQRTFKQVMGISPGEYVTQQKKISSQITI